MNIKRGIFRFSIVVSVLWGLLLFILVVKKPEMSIPYLKLGISTLIVWWAVIYIGFWVTAGFRGKPKKE